ncbi:MAG: hypothetical protein WC253_03290 [Sulfurovaceae bacterium]
MNSLLLEQPIYINRLYIHIAGEMEAGIFLDHIFKKFSEHKSNAIELDIRLVYKTLYFYKFEIEKINKKLKKLPFLFIQKTSKETYCYSIDLEKYETYLNKRISA